MAFSYKSFTLTCGSLDRCSDRFGAHGPGPVLVIEIEQDSSPRQTMFGKRRGARFVIMSIRGDIIHKTLLELIFLELEVRTEDKITAVRGSGTIVLEGTVEV